MPTRIIQVDFLTSSYRVVGKINATGGGVLGILGDKTTSLMEVKDASMARIHMATKLVEQVQLVKVVKSQVLAVCLTKREDVGPLASPRTGYARLYEYPIRITTPIYELEGTLEYGGRFDLSIILTEGTCDFIPLFDASLGAILFPSLLIQSPAILFNRTYLNTLVLMSEGI